MSNNYAMGWNDCLARVLRDGAPPADFIALHFESVPDTAPDVERARSLAARLRAIAKVEAARIETVPPRTPGQVLEEAMRRTEWHAADMLESLASSRAEAPATARAARRQGAPDVPRGARH